MIGQGQRDQGGLRAPTRPAGHSGAEGLRTLLRQPQEDQDQDQQQQQTLQLPKKNKLARAVPGTAIKTSAAQAANLMKITIATALATAMAVAVAVAMALATAISPAAANPLGPTVVSGQASFSQQGNVFSITNTPRAIIDWNSFSIGAGERTRFIQQGSGSAVLNRITGQDPSVILGTLTSNGRVLLLNPNGIVFGAGAQINVAGLVASTLALTNADFLAGRMNFSAGPLAGSVLNSGSIVTPSGGQVVLIAPEVSNNGIIRTPQGEVLLAAGRSVQLADTANPDMQVVVSAPADQAVNLGQLMAQGGRIGIQGALVRQAGQLNADSAVLGERGKIVLRASRTLLLEAGSTTTARAEGTGGEVQALGQQVGLRGDALIDVSGVRGGGKVLIGGDIQGSNPAIMNADQVVLGPAARVLADAGARGNGGSIVVWADRSARVYGSLSARGGALAGDGGFIETSGHYLDVAGIRVDASAPHGVRGKWLLDPYDITVGENNDEFPLSNVESFNVDVDAPPVLNASQISASLAEVILQARNDIYFNSPIDIQAPGVSLTAQAGNNIEVRAPINTNGGALTLSANDNGGGTRSGTGTVIIAADIALTTQGGQLTLAGINVLPSLPTCLANPAATGCASVLPTLAACQAAPSTPGCSAVLPTAGACATNPATPGCEPVLPALSACLVRPELAGCAAVLPGVADCVANPGRAGCVVVLPSLSACTGMPTIQGCSAVLPSLATCVGNPATPGCNAVLPSLATCALGPSTPGCAVVLPSLAACVSNPAAPGCNTVLPSLAACKVTPGANGCSVVLPSLSICAAAPGIDGCTAVLPTLAQCLDSALPAAPWYCPQSRPAPAHRQCRAARSCCPRWRPVRPIPPCPAAPPGSPPARPKRMHR